METEDIISNANELISLANTLKQDDWAKFRGVHARVSDFLILLAGKNSSFLSQIDANSLPSDKPKKIFN